MKVKEENIIEFDEFKYQIVVNGLKQFAKLINDKPVVGNNPRDLDALRRSGISNESFVSICQRLDLTPSDELLMKVLHRPSHLVIDIISKEVEVVLDRSKIQPVLRPSVMKSYESAIREFEYMISKLSYAATNQSHALLTSTGLSFQIEQYITFIDGFATISEATLEALKENFITRLDSDTKKETLDLLVGIAELVNKFNANISFRGLNLTSIDIQGDYFDFENNLAVPNHSIIKYF